VRLSAPESATAWVDPAVQIWNRSLLDNLHYGVESAGRKPLSAAIQGANLFDVLERLPDGLQTVLGEGGGLVSGGEGQRVRLGRSLMRPAIRLVLLDEAFRGLDPDRSVRRYWSRPRAIAPCWRRKLVYGRSSVGGRRMATPVAGRRRVEGAFPNRWPSI